VTTLKVIVEEHADGFIAYPLGLRGVCIGEGDTYEDAVGDVSSAIRMHIEVFGRDAFEEDADVIAAFVTDTAIGA
jgi:predicted RNase H-like HicB family nuclease